MFWNVLNFFTWKCERLLHVYVFLVIYASISRSITNLLAWRLIWDGRTEGSGMFPTYQAKRGRLIRQPSYSWAVSNYWESASMFAFYPMLNFSLCVVSLIYWSMSPMALITFCQHFFVIGLLIFYYQGFDGLKCTSVGFYCRFNNQLNVARRCCWAVWGGRQHKQVREGILE